MLQTLLTMHVYTIVMPRKYPFTINDMQRQGNHKFLKEMYDSKRDNPSGFYTNLHKHLGYLNELEKIITNFSLPDFVIDVLVEEYDKQVRLVNQELVLKEVPTSLLMKTFSEIN